MKLPLVVSVPHAGREVPAYLADRIMLTESEIEQESDRGARPIFSGLEPLVEAYREVEIARAILDVNRSEEDRSKDGVIKTHTQDDKLVWNGALDDETVQRLLEAHYRPYHHELSNFARRRNVILGIDCRTQADGPVVSLWNGKGTCSDDTIGSLSECFARAFGVRPAVNPPGSGSYSLRRHATELEWVELSISESGGQSSDTKAKALRVALELWSSRRKQRWR